MLRVKYLFLCLFGLLFTLTSGSLFSQVKVFSVLNVTSKSFPKVRAYYDASIKTIGRDGKENFEFRTDLSSSDFTLTETIPGKGTISIPTTAFTQRCSTLKDGPAVRVILVIDNSFSMAEPAGTSGLTRMQVVKNGAKAFVNNVDFIDPTAVSIVSFASEAKLKQPFTKNVKALETAIDAIEPAGNTNYDEAFFGLEGGAITLFKKDTNYIPPDVRRVIIYLTDGEPSMGDMVDPDKKVKDAFLKKVSDELAANNITMFAITAFIKMNSDLRNWSSQTGGRTYEVLSKDPQSEMDAIYREIANLLSKKNLCWLEWTSPYGCNEESRYRTVEITIPKDGLKGSAKYVAPDSSVASIRVSHTGVSFGNPPANGTSQKSVRLTAVNATATLTNPVFAATNCGTYRVVSPPPPIIIEKGKFVDVVLEFKQGPAQVYCPSTLSFTSDPCPPPQLALFGGVNTVQLINPSPTTSSVLSSCEDIVITYDGVTPIEKNIQIDYSSDNGVTWNTLTETATGGQYTWKSSDLKLLPKDGKFKLRLIEKADEKFIWAGSGGGSSSDSAFTIQIGANDDDLFVAGIFKNSIKFGNSSVQLTNSSSTDFAGFVAKYSAISGNPIWATPFTSTKEIKAKAATCNDKIGAQQRIYVTGSFTGVAKLGNLERQANDVNKTSMFLAVLNDAGTISNAIHLGSSINAIGEMQGTNVAYDAAKKIVYVRGLARGRIEYTAPTGTTTFNSGSDTDWSEFMAEFDEQGVLQKVSYGVIGSIKTWVKNSVKDKANNNYETGTYSGKKSFPGAGEVTSVGSTDVYVSKKGVVQGSQSVSQVPFEISVAQLAMVNDVKTFNLGSVPVGSVDSKTITGAQGLGNFGNIETVITKVELSNPTEFKLNENLEGRVLSANAETLPLNFLCTPNAQNQRCTEVTIYGECSDPLKFIVCVNGLPPCTNEFVKNEVFDQTIINVKNQKTFNRVYVNQTAVIRKMKVYLTGDGANTVYKLVDANGGNTPNANNEIILSLQPNQQLDVTISYTPTKEGQSCVNLNYETTNFTCDIPFTKFCGEAIAPVDASVENATWECQKPNTKVGKLVAFKNTGNIPIVIKNVATSNPAFTVSSNDIGQKVDIGGTRNIAVDFTPVNAIPYSADLTVTFTDENNATQEVQRSSVLRGDGCEPKVTLDKNCFNSVVIGQSTTKDDAIIVENSGNFPLVVTNITVAPNNEFTVDGPTSFTLQPNETPKRIKLTFAPNAAGNRTAIVTVFSDATEASKTIEICGIGVPAGNAIDFRDVFYCDKKDSVYTFPTTPVSQDIEITASITGTGDETSFSISPTKQTVLAGETPKWTITCQPKRGGNSLNATLSFNIAGVGTTDFQLIANPKTANISVTMDPKELKEFKIGSSQRFTVKMSSDILLQGLNLDTITAEISYNPTMFYYKEGSFVSNTLGEIIWDTPKEVKNGTLRVQSKEIPKLPSELQRDLFSVELVSVLGDAYSDVVRAKVLFPDQYSTCLNVQTDASVEFATTEVCFDQGRGINIGSSINAPVISPNPSSTSAKIDFTVGIESSTMLYVVNQMGERVMTLIDEKLKQGSYSTVLDLSNISSGAYHIVYKCGPYSFTQPMTIAK